MRMLKLILFTCAWIALFIPTEQIRAQNTRQVKVKFEEIQKQCKDLPLEDRVRMAVTRFSISTPSCTKELGDNMSTMLTNALTEIRCFRMLEMLQKASDWKGELAYGNSAGAERRNHAQVVVTGEITEFTIQKKSGGALMVRGGKEIVKLGFVIKLINPETRDILFSKSINVEGKSARGLDAVLFRKFWGGIHLGSSGNDNKAIANALEQGVLIAAKYIGERKNELSLPDPSSKSSTSTTITRITVFGADYTSISRLTSELSSFSGVKNVDNSLEDSHGTISVEHTNSSKKILDKLVASSGKSFSVKSFREGQVSIQMKIK